MKYAIILVFFLLWTGVAQAELFSIYSFIMNCESNENPNAVNWKDAELRKDKQPSIGLFQFYWGTWVKYAKIYKVIPETANLTIEQVNKYLYDPVYNAVVAHAMIRDGLTDHWQTCHEKYLSYNLTLNFNRISHPDG